MSQDNEILVKVNSVSKKFCRDLKKSLWYGVKDVASELLPFGKGAGRREQGDASLNTPEGSSASTSLPLASHVSSLPASSLRPGEFWANKDISFELRRGECIGLIGHNGAGKTTLLKMLNGLIKPDSGTIEMRGRVGALIALGAGFNPILTGRENIYVNGSILGLTKEEIDEKIDDIIAFAQIPEFIDSPVQSYSSGMQVRLGFAVATALDPDILILDEVLAVGDAAFRHKCYHRINKLIKNCAVILVSHSMDQIGAIAKSVGMMHRGAFELYKDPAAGISAYNQAMQDSMTEGTEDGGSVFEIYPPIINASVRLLKSDVEYGSSLDIEISFECSAPLENMTLSFTAVNQNEQPVMNWNLSRSEKRVRLESGNSIFRFRIAPIYLHDGKYLWNLWVGRVGSIEACIYAMRAGHFNVVSRFKPISNIPYLPSPDHFEIQHYASTSAL